ncbi:hypothetical protein Dsin_012500 [Dipteronia sinensis]|uniref:YTH domain-containing family protein n=1 Tax=Dipteronia sinensis TaxID=43782 RepID=A0AAE0E9H3_9ROSI|nr:hypothetical protein Dsin_012500 [Dipteronia sinensis]
MMNNRKVDPSTQLPNSDKVLSKEGSPSDATSCVSSAGDAAGSVKESDDVDHESASTDQASTYSAAPSFGYYYPGFDGSSGEADNRGYYVANDGMELQYPVIQADNGAFMYVMPAFQPGYNSYSPYLPVAAFGVDGQYLGQQPYSPSPMIQSPIASPGYYPNPLTYGELVPSAYPWDPSFYVGDALFGNGYIGVPETPSSKYNISSASRKSAPLSKTNLHSDFSNSQQMKNSLPSLDVSSGHGMRNQLKSTSKALQHGPTFQSDALGKNYIAKFPLYNQGKGGVLYPNNQAKANTRGWDGIEKPKTKGQVNSISDFGSLGEQNYAPRTTNDKGSFSSGGNAAAPLAIDGNGKTNSINSLNRRDQYNLSDFPTKYDQAFFFVIKSYSEDDIHKSIKYNVWASTPNGNKRLDSAFEDAQDKMGTKGSKCPVFLFFSVNASGQFCGVAEMIGRVDFNRNMDFWQQDKWNGYFPVKWHIIKDVPNPQLRHIILENNDNKPVTNSRDTQEVKFPQGTEMLNIFKNYASKTSILDDFEFYESRQKVLQEKRIRPSIPNFGLIQVCFCFFLHSTLLLGIWQSFIPFIGCIYLWDHVGIMGGGGL